MGSLRTTSPIFDLRSEPSKTRHGSGSSVPTNSLSITALSPISPFDLRPHSDPQIHKSTTRDTSRLERDPYTWLTSLFAAYVKAGFSSRHDAFWSWVWSMMPSVSPQPFVGIWPRGGGKSTSAELATVAIGARGVRPYAVYIRETQEQADKSIQNIAGLLESRAFADAYPAMADRDVNKYGSSKGWRRNRLRTAAGYTVDALGLDAAGRGAKVDEDRPGLLIFDDIDGKHDTPETTKKKIEIITTSLLPAGAANVAVLMMQNMIHGNSIFAQLADGRADFLLDRVVSGPFPAVEDLTYELTDTGYVVTGGVPTWDGQNLETCQQQINTWGLTAFLHESQHKVFDPSKAMFRREWWQRYTPASLPAMTRIEQYIDSAFKDGVGNDYSVIATWGTDGKGNYYVLDVWRDKKEYPDLIQAIHAQHAKHSSHGLQVAIVIEDKASGQSALQTLRRPLAQLDGTVLPALPVIPFPQPGNKQQEELARLSKIARAEGVTPLVQGGRVFVPERASWLEDFLAEHEHFPNGPFDDQVDPTSMALARLPRTGVRAY